MKPAPFEYHRPSTSREAVELLADLEDVKLLAGGQSLIPMLALRLAVFHDLVDIGRIAEIEGIRRDNGSLWIGAGTRQAEIERSSVVAEAAPLLRRATRNIGHSQIRNRGTLGGSLAHADPAAEYPAVALALDAGFEALSTRGSRTIPASEFFTGVWTTALDEDELLTGVSFPVWSGRCGFAMEEVARRHGDFAIAGAAVGVEVSDDDRVERCRIGLVGLGPTALRAADAEQSVTGVAVSDLDTDEAGRAAVADLDDIPSDIHASLDYRSRVGAAMVDRALTEAIEEATGG